jgi:hypothetical protein
MMPDDLTPGTELVVRLVIGVEGVSRGGGVVVSWVHEVAAHLDSDGSSPCGCNACELHDRFDDLAHREGCIVPFIREHTREVFMDVF